MPLTNEIGPVGFHPEVTCRQERWKSQATGDRVREGSFIREVMNREESRVEVVHERLAAHSQDSLACNNPGIRLNRASCIMKV